MAINSRAELAAAYASAFTYLVSKPSHGTPFVGYNRITYFPVLGLPTPPPNMGTLSGALNSATAGAIPLPAPAAGKTWYLADMQVAHSAEGPALLLDRYCQSAAVSTSNVNVAQTVTGCSVPARVTDLTAGHQLWIEVIGTISSTANLTASYTNENGVSGRTATLLGGIQSVGTSTPGAAYGPFVLQSGDLAVTSVQSIIFPSGAVTGAPTAHLVLAKPIAAAWSNLYREGQRRGWSDLGLPDVGASPCLYFMAVGSATVYQFGASLTFVQG